MVRIAWMNLLLHDLESPEIHQLDALSKRLGDDQSGTYDTILANPPFTGSVDEGDLSENRQRFTRHGKAATPLTTKSELLFAWLMLDLLKIGGRAAVIVPDGVLFGSTNAHTELRRQLLFENTLEAVVSLPAYIFQPYSGVKTSILVFQKAATPVAKGDAPRTREVWFYEITDEAYSLDQKRKPLPGQDNDLWDALQKFKAWTHYRNGDGEAQNSIATDYHQPVYWEERWRAVDDDALKVFPSLSGNKGHTFRLHELWKADFKNFSTTDLRGSRQYDDIILARARPAFEKAARELTEASVAHTLAESKTPDAEKTRTAADKAVKALTTALQKMARDGNLLDREFDQFGLNATKTLLKELTAKVPDWIAATPPPKPTEKKKGAKPDLRRKPPMPDPDHYAKSLLPQLTEFAKLDGYNVWRRSGKTQQQPGKLTLAEDGKKERRPSLQSWIVPVRKWAERESWGEDPATKAPIAKPTHKDSLPDPDYLNWLRDTLKVFADDATVKEEHRDRLDPECLEALGFNLSAGRHKPFIFDPGQHRPPAELIHELQALHDEVQTRLGKLLGLVEDSAPLPRSRVKGAGKLPVL